MLTAHYSLIYVLLKERKEARHRRRDEAYTKFPKVTISAHKISNDKEIMVPLQRTYTDTKPVISASLANTLCTTLGLQSLLEQLNITLGTSCSLETPAVISLLEDCIANKYDFGTAYGRYRAVWYTDDWSTVPDELRKCKEMGCEN
ncbi:hypothetical protein EV421DRAFT_1907157 [Armillaria borealis]|uniref:Uncharacterized protein n=1 Tax=Armillaria borealis TaxID=47425 RepID=A0AA39MKW4_9AGAR|nr:hypothetical protein EV421DRAFT_1907157 [Armillaria borealis]